MLYGGRKLRQFINAQTLLNFSHLIHYGLKAIFTK